MFNRHSRWDRTRPETERGLNDPIGVLVSFYRGQVVPKILIWGNRKIPVQKVLYHWRDRVGEEHLHYFSVADGANIYEIVFNNQSLGWHLCGTEPMISVPGS